MSEKNEIDNDVFPLGESPNLLKIFKNKEIGRGAFGRVFVGDYHDKKVAVKVLILPP